MTSSSSPSHYYADGGISAFMPPIGDIRISPFPRRIFVPVILSRPPHIFLPKEVYPTSKLVGWILKPAPEPVLRELYRQGFLAAERWITANLSMED
jgi:hypothetical protein